MITRRKLLRDGLAASAGLAAGPWVVNLAGCGKGGAGIAGPDEVVFGLYPRDRVETGEEAVRLAAEHLDLSWLGAGDSVLLKLACNSGNDHPAVTSPAAVRGLCQLLFARGAGRIIAADQAGVESVRLAPGEQRFGSTRKHMEKNGLLRAIEESGAEPHFFDEQGYEAGYFQATLPFEGSHWTRPMFLPKVLKEVDHLVYLPRLSSHAICGYTHAHKLAMGWLRDDSRNHVHHDAASMYEKYVEINHAQEIRDRYRLTLSLAESLMLDFGPDTGTVAIADPRMVIASRNMAHHDALSVGVLVHLDRITPRNTDLVYDPSAADGYNRAFLMLIVPNGTGIPWGPGVASEYAPLVPHRFERGLAQDRVLRRAFELAGGAPSRIRVLSLDAAPDPDLAESLRVHGGGIFEFA